MVRALLAIRVLAAQHHGAGAQGGGVAEDHGAAVEVGAAGRCWPPGSSRLPLLLVVVRTPVPVMVPVRVVTPGVG